MFHSQQFTAVDQAQEHGNKRCKGPGGLSGITTNPEALLQYCLTAPIFSKLSAQNELMIGVSFLSTKDENKLLNMRTYFWYQQKSLG